MLVLLVWGYYIVIYNPELDPFRIYGSRARSKFPNPIDRTLLHLTRGLVRAGVSAATRQSDANSASAPGESKANTEGIEDALFKACSSRRLSLSYPTTNGHPVCQVILRPPDLHWTRNFDQRLQGFYMCAFSPITGSLSSIWHGSR